MVMVFHLSRPSLEERLQLVFRRFRHVGGWHLMGKIRNDSGVEDSPLNAWLVEDQDGEPQRVEYPRFQVVPRRRKMHRVLQLLRMALDTAPVGNLLRLELLEAEDESPAAL